MRSYNEIEVAKIVAMREEKLEAKLQIAVEALEKIDATKSFYRNEHGLQCTSLIAKEALEKIDGNNHKNNG